MAGGSMAGGPGSEALEMRCRGKRGAQRAGQSVAAPKAVISVSSRFGVRDRLPPASREEA
jgi:hypothetical protein